MARNPNIAVVTIGYTKYAFEDVQSALELMAIMSRAVLVEEKTYGMDGITECTHFLDDSREMPELKFIAASRFNPHETVKEVKERAEREAKDREDLNQPMGEVREFPVLAAPRAPVDDGIPF